MHFCEHSPKWQFWWFQFFALYLKKSMEIELKLRHSEPLTLLLNPCFGPQNDENFIFSQENLCIFVNNFRHNLGLSRIKLAQKLGISKATLERIEYGKTPLVHPLLGKLATAIGTTPDAIILYGESVTALREERLFASKENLAHSIRLLRLALGCTRQEFADICDLSVKQYTRVEHGKTWLIHPVTFELLQKNLDGKPITRKKLLYLHRLIRKSYDDSNRRP